MISSSDTSDDEITEILKGTESESAAKNVNQDTSSKLPEWDGRASEAIRVCRLAE